MRGAVPVPILPRLKPGQRHCVTFADQEKRRKESVGKTFNFLTIEGFDPNDLNQAIVRCQCGVTRTMLASSVRSGTFKSCGCMKRMRHGFSKAGKRHYLYYRWANIRSRTTDVNNNAYHSYGGRGIRMHQSWVDSAETFITDILESIGERPTPEHTLDRKNNDGNYEPGNLKWATRKEQANNRRAFELWKPRGFRNLEGGDRK